MKKFTKREWEIMILSILTTSAVISTIFTKINEKKEQKRMDYKVIRDMTTESNPNPVDSIYHGKKETLYFKNGRLVGAVGKK